MRFCILWLFLISASAANAQVVAQYLFDGTNSVSPSSEAAHVTASSLTQVGVTQTQTGSSLFFAATDWPVNVYSASYFQLTLTPDPGYAINYNLVSMEYGMGTNPTFTFALRSSLDGFSSDIVSHVAVPGNNTYSDSLASLGTQSGPVTFRWYGQVDANVGLSGFAAGSMTVSSSQLAVVPEPTAMAFCAMALAFLTFARHRRLDASVASS